MYKKFAQITSLNICAYNLAIFHCSSLFNLRKKGDKITLYLYQLPDCRSPWQTVHSCGHGRDILFWGRRLVQPATVAFRLAQNKTLQNGHHRQNLEAGGPVLKRTSYYLSVYNTPMWGWVL